MSQKPFRKILADWIGEMHMQARETLPDGTPKMGKFETEELYRQGKKFLETPEFEPKFGELTNAQRERLEMLAEEAAEIVQCCTKILRRGYSHHPHRPGRTNKRELQDKLLQFWTVYERMAHHGDLAHINFCCTQEVWEKLEYTTHHQDKQFHHPTIRSGS